MVPVRLAGRSRLDVPLPLVVGVGAVLLAAVVGLVLLRRSRRTAVERPELVDVPLVVDSLVKTYADGLRAAGACPAGRCRGGRRSQARQYWNSSQIRRARYLDRPTG